MLGCSEDPKPPLREAKGLAAGVDEPKLKAGLLSLEVGKEGFASLPNWKAGLGSLADEPNWKDGLDSFVDVPNWKAGLDSFVKDPKDGFDSVAIEVKAGLASDEVAKLNAGLASVKGLDSPKLNEGLASEFEELPKLNDVFGSAGFESPKEKAGEGLLSPKEKAGFASTFASDGLVSPKEKADFASTFASESLESPKVKTGLASAGLASPKEKAVFASAGFESPKEKADFASESLASPNEKAGLDSVGFASPKTGFESPNEKAGLESEEELFWEPKLKAGFAVSVVTGVTEAEDPNEKEESAGCALSAVALSSVLAPNVKAGLKEAAAGFRAVVAEAAGLPEEKHQASSRVKKRKQKMKSQLPLREHRNRTLASSLPLFRSVPSIVGTAGLPSIRAPSFPFPIQRCEPLVSQSRRVPLLPFA